MSIVVQERQQLSADALFRLVRSGLAHSADARLSEPDISLTDTLMAAFAMFSLTSPSLLAFDKARAEGNWATIDGLERVPCDTHMREIRDAVAPESLHPGCKRVLRHVPRGKAREALAFLDGHDLLALDGTG